MNKRGIGYQSISTMEYAFLVILAIFFSVIVYNGGLEEQQVNELKAEDLGLTIDSVFLVEQDLGFTFDLGKEYYVNEEIKRIRIYETSESKLGIANLAIDEGYDFAEIIKGKTNKVSVEKKGNRVVIS